MTQVFGDFIEIEPRQDREFLQIGFSPASTPIQERWRNNGLSADFVADYLSSFFPASKDNPQSRRRQAEIKSAVSFIANELLENAMKYTYEPSRYPIKFRLELLEQGEVGIVLYTTNSLSPDHQERFQTFIRDFLTFDSQEFYLSQLEKSVELSEGESSGLGLLSMKNDYDAKLGWKFETLHQDPPIHLVTTMIYLSV